MGWSVEAIIALVTLLATGPAPILVLWNYFKNRNRRVLRGECLLPTTRVKEKERTLTYIVIDRQHSRAMVPWTLTRMDTEYNLRLLEAGLGTHHVPAGQYCDLTELG